MDRSLLSSDADYQPRGKRNVHVYSHVCDCGGSVDLQRCGDGCKYGGYRNGTGTLRIEQHNNGCNEERHERRIGPSDVET